MKDWYMVTVVGEDRPGIVARLTKALYEAGCNLGEASMVRLGGNFTIMLMAGADMDRDALSEALRPIAKELRLRVHVDPIRAHLHEHMEPNVEITVFSADRAGIVAETTEVLAQAGLHILDLNSDVGGTEDKPVYVMVIDGYAANGVEALDKALAQVRKKGIEAELAPIDTMIG